MTSYFYRETSISVRRFKINHSYLYIISTFSKLFLYQVITCVDTCLILSRLVIAIISFMFKVKISTLHPRVSASLNVPPTTQYD